MKKDEKPDILAVINNYNFYDRQTNRETNRRIWRLYDQPGPEGRVGEKLKNSAVFDILNIERKEKNKCLTKESKGKFYSNQRNFVGWLFCLITLAS